MINSKPSDILKNAFERLKQDEKVTVRALAEKLEISEAFLSQILNNKKRIPLKKRRKFYEVFNLDRDAINNLENLLSLELLQKYDFIQPRKKTDIEVSDFQELPQKKYEVLDKWYYITILDLLTCDNISSDLDTISHKIGISKQETFDSLITLFKLGLAHEDKQTGLWIKTHHKARFPTSKSHSEIRGYHRQILKKAIQELDDSRVKFFEKRYIGCFSVATNPKNVEKARDHICNSIYEAVEILGEGICSEVYNINLQILPMTF